MRRVVASGLALVRATVTAVMFAQSSDTPRVCYDVLMGIVVLFCSMIICVSTKTASSSSSTASQQDRELRPEEMDGELLFLFNFFLLFKLLAILIPPRES